LHLLLNQNEMNEENPYIVKYLTRRLTMNTRTDEFTSSSKYKKNNGVLVDRGLLHVIK
jgi:hypothetical protein